MKRLLLIALAILAVFAAISCTAEAEPSDYDWGQANTRNETGGSNVDYPSIDAYSMNAAKKNPHITVVFPPEADVLRSKDIEASLKTFLTFHTFTNPTETDWENLGKISTLSPEIPYEYVTMAGSRSIKVELQKDFTLLTTDYSHLIAKFNGKTYTHSHGIKMDANYKNMFDVGNGIPGEDVVDDLYLEKYLDGMQYWDFVAPQEQMWCFDFSGRASSFSPSWTGTAQTSDSEPVLPAVYIELNGDISSITANGKATYKKIADEFKDSFKLQEYSSGKWTDVKIAVYDPVYTEYLVFKDVTFKHMGVYRLYWSGSANLKTSETYFGVKQRICVVGDYPEPIAMDPPSLVKQYSMQTMAVSDTIFCTNPNLYEEIEAGPAIRVFSSDTSNRNIVLRLEFPILGSGSPADPFVGLQEMPADKFKGGNASFKLVYGSDGMSDFAAGEYTAAKIDSIRYAKEGDIPYTTDANTAHTNVIYITLNPAEQNRYYNLHINDDFAYTGSTPKRVFGDRLNHTGKYFRHYDSEYELAAGTADARFSINVTAGNNYTIHWNDAGQGDWSKTLDVYVSAQYQNGTAIFTNTDSGYYFPQAFTALWGGTVTLTVTKKNPANSGTYAIWYEIEALTTPYPKMIPGVWTNGSLGAGQTETKFCFPVTSGNVYRVWWNDRDSGDSTKMDVRASAQYHASGTAIFTSMDNGWSSAQSFTASQDGLVVVTIVPYNAGGTGDFAVTYTVNNATRP